MSYSSALLVDQAQRYARLFLYPFAVCEIFKGNGDFPERLFSLDFASIEVKTSDRVNSDDFKGLETLRNITKNDFICGVVLYAGNNVVSFGEGLLAVPLSALWQ